MIRGTWWTYALWTGRTLAGFTAAVLLAFGGDITGRVINLLLGFPWSQQVHVNIHLVAIGIGAGIGAHLGWMNFSLNRYWGLAILAIVLTASVIGVYLGRALGPGVDPSYWWSRYAVDSTIHISAAIAGTVVATTVGLTHQIILIRRDNSRQHISSMTTTGSHSPNLP
ncbi:MAG: hypothetical protein O2909_11800 [Chloroflexi bacterium]|nr:hypothetical protein [Chloroflexota bacterium]MDA1220105.1 hypothetical protein [Chloroflexota bacterium]